MKDAGMSVKEADQVVIFERLKLKEITQDQAAKILKLSVRQIKRKLKRYLKEGWKGLCHKTRGRPGSRAMEPVLRQRIIEILGGRLKGLGPTMAAEKLWEMFEIDVCHETVRQIMIEQNLWEPKKKKLKKLHVWRERKHFYGELVQVDGSKHLWFNGEYYTLIAFIDDATGKIMQAMFTNEETIKDLSMSTYAYIKRHGRPLAFYVDRGKVYKVNKGKTNTITQYHRMLNELNIELIFAYSPQAKGRIERLFKTLQDRLCKELALHGITTLEAANIFLQSYIDIFNNMFAVEPKEPTDMHKTCDGLDLKSIFCIKENRILKDDYTIVHKERWFQLDKKQPVFLQKKQKITVAIAFDGTISLWANGKRLGFKEIPKKLPRTQRKEERIVKNSYYKPPRSHPWRTWTDDISKLEKR